MQGSLVLNELFVDRTWRLYENKKGGPVLFSVKFRNENPPEGGMANEVRVHYDKEQFEMKVGEAIVRRAMNRIDIDPAGGNAMVDVEIMPLAK